MVLVLNQLKNISPALVWEDEKKIEKIIFYLEKEGFQWEEFRKFFYNKNLNIIFTIKDFERLLINPRYLEEKLKKEVNKKEERFGEVRAAGIVINFLVFLVIINFFLGWIIFHIFFWVLFEGVLVFLLVSFMKIKKKIKNVN